MKIELPPQYDPKAVESAIYKKWLDARVFHAVPDGRGREQRYSIVIPPPNVTGALHLGHAINGTIQDVLTRYHRMKGDNTMWMPGIDHAGIATQAVVEKSIFEKEKKSRHDLGREELVRRIWEWKEQFGTRILNQLQSIGASCDWDRTRFTLDDVCAKAVREAFFKMFKDGLIFRGKRLVNWDTHLQTAVADDEIYHEAVKGQMTSIKYPVADGEEEKRRQGDKETEYLVVATTRPETMLGDTAVAVHPDDPRYKHLHGKHVIVPLVGRRIPVVCDGLLVDPKFGTGVVKVTPAHDPNDYATGVRHNLEQINLLTADGKVNENGAGEFLGKKYSYAGLKFATAARKQVLADLEELGLIADKKVHEHEVGHSDRSKTPIEPFLSDQWFVRMGDIAQEAGTKGAADGNPRLTASQSQGVTLADGTRSSGLAQAAMDAVTSGRVKITPERYAKGYVDWLAQKRDWCISRQLWWGHRIPVWRVYPHYPLLPDSLAQALQSSGAEGFASLADAVAHSQNRTQPQRQPTQAEKELLDFQRTHDTKIIELIEKHFTARSMSGDIAIWREQTFTYVCARTEAAQRELENLTTELIDKVVQEEDVLDTWFSSALWPISTMGWPGTAGKYSSIWSRAMWEGENYTEAAVRAYFQKHVFLPALNNDTEKAAAAMKDFDCAYAGNRLDITFRNADLEKAVESTIITMGYTRKAGSTPEANLLDYFYPTSLLSTAREILTLWVARMVIFGLYCKGDVPFRDVYIHAIIQDGEGRPMKKTLGNGVDPVDIVKSHGADALRFTLASMATETQDIRLPVQLVCPHCQERLPSNVNGPVVIGCPKCKKQMTRPVQTAVATAEAPMSHSTSDRFDLGRNFANKIWNASRYILNCIEDGAAKDERQKTKDESLEDRWILSRLNATIEAVGVHINAYRFADMADALRTFFWTDLCDWYLEISKARIRAGDAEVQAILLHCLKTTLKLLHPVMPFITEELWSKLPGGAGSQGMLVTESWPVADASLRDGAAEQQMALIQAVTSAIREIQNRYPAAKGKGVVLVPRDAGTQGLLAQSQKTIEALVGSPIAENAPAAAKPENAATTVLPEVQVYIGGVIDKAAEIAKLTKRRDELKDKFIPSARGKLANEAAVAKVPPNVAQGWRDQLAKLEEELAAIERNLAELQG